MRLSTSASLAGSCKVRWEMGSGLGKDSGVAALEVKRTNSITCLHSSTSSS